jgi:hypothetical protein
MVMALYVKTSLNNYSFNIIGSVLVALLLTFIVGVPQPLSLQTVLLPILLALASFRIGEYLLTGKSIESFKFLFGPEVQGKDAKRSIYVHFFSLVILVLLLVIGFRLR